MSLHRPNRRRTVRTRVASRRPRTRVRLTTTTGYRPLPNGLTVVASCRRDGHALELMTTSPANGRHEMSAALRCPECRQHYALHVLLALADTSPVRQTSRRAS